jgi:hypothetical protein
MSFRSHQSGMRFHSGRFAAPVSVRPRASRSTYVFYVPHVVESF